MSGFEVDPVRVNAAASGIHRIINDFTSIGVDRIVGPDAQYGHDGLHAAFREFCERWQPGVSALLADAGTLAGGLSVMMRRYEQSDSAFGAAAGSAWPGGR